MFRTFWVLLPTSLMFAHLRFWWLCPLIGFLGCSLMSAYRHCDYHRDVRQGYHLNAHWVSALARCCRAGSQLVMIEATVHGVFHSTTAQQLHCVLACGSLGYICCAGLDLMGILPTAVCLFVSHMLRVCLALSWPGFAALTCACRSGLLGSSPFGHASTQREWMWAEQVRCCLVTVALPTFSADVMVLYASLGCFISLQGSGFEGLAHCYLALYMSLRCRCWCWWCWCWCCWCFRFGVPFTSLLLFCLCLIFLTF